MRSFIPVAGLAALAVASPCKPEPEPTNKEEVKIENFSVITTEQGEVMSASFSLTADDVTDLTCSANEIDLPSKVYTCGETKYRFALVSGEEETYALRLYHELGIAFGFYGQSDVFTYCHAGGLQRMFCTQQFPVSFIIDSEPDVESKGEAGTES